MKVKTEVKVVLCKLRDSKAPEARETPGAASASQPSRGTRPKSPAPWCPASSPLRAQPPVVLATQAVGLCDIRLGS